MMLSHVIRIFYQLGKVKLSCDVFHCCILHIDTRDKSIVVVVLLLVSRGPLFQVFACRERTLGSLHQPHLFHPQ